MVIPKSQQLMFFEIDDELLAHAHIVAKKVATALKEATGCEGVNILQNNGEIAGQSVFHLHIHVIPRYSKDDANIKWTPGTQECLISLMLSQKKVQKIFIGMGLKI